jgi:V8-like Glu-specific endopeptidase
MKSYIIRSDSTFRIPTIELPKTNNDSLAHYYNSLGKNTPFMISKCFTQNIRTNKNGMWKINDDKTLTWLCKIVSKTAFSLNFVIENISFPKESKLYIIHSDNNNSSGPYSWKNVNEDSTIYTEQIPGDSVVFELDVPINTDTTKSYFTISNICHDFRDFYTINASNRSSGSCEHDINCGIGLNWQHEKNAVVKFTLVRTTGPKPGTYGCTGTLINNTTNNELPYLLTANHCVKDAKEAASGIFYFNYENTVCGTFDANTTHSLSGAKLVATTKDTTAILDFSLLRLNTLPPRNFTPYYAGWSIKNIAENNVVAIHHPNYDVKKISYSANNIVDSSFTEEPGYLHKSHWQITKWDTGATEHISSGCPLFNTKHQIIGNLTGGDSDCDYPYNDFFAKFSKSWDYFSDSSYQLKYWLDPINLGLSECVGYDPQIGSDNPVSNVIYNEELVTYNFGNSVKGGWTGFNDPRLLQCADRFSGIKNQYIYAIKFPIQLFNKSVDVKNVKLMIWSGIDKPDQIIYSDYLNRDSIISNKYYCIRLANKIYAGSNFFIGFDLSSLNNNDSLFLYTVKNRTNGSNSLYFNYKNKWVQSSNLGLNSSLGLEIYVTDNILPARKTTNLPEKLLSIDTDSLINLSTNELFHLDSVSNFDESGWLILHYLTENKGLWSGSNQNGISQFAEIYSFISTSNNYISGIKIAVAKNTITNSETKIRLSILSNLQITDSVIYSIDINANELKPNYYNVIKFPPFLKKDSSLNIILSLQNIAYPDTFALFMGNPVDNKNIVHSYFKNSVGWLNYNMYNIQENLGLSLETIYGQYVYDTLAHNYSYKIKNKQIPSDSIFKSFFIYPNPCSTAIKELKLNMGNYFSKNVTISIFDIYGRIIYNPVPQFNNENIIIISTSNLSSGIYFVKITIDKQIYRPIPLIITQ